MKYLILCLLFFSASLSHATVVIFGQDNRPPLAVQKKMKEALQASCPETSFSALVVSDLVTTQEQVNRTPRVQDTHYTTLFRATMTDGFMTTSEFVIEAIVLGDSSRIQTLVTGCR